MILHRSIPLQLARKRLLPLMLAALIAPGSAYAIDMTTAFALAKRNDPKFQAAKAEMEANKSQSVRDWASYAPTFTWNQQQLPTLSSTSTTF
jgi:hypothetical protein